MPKTVSDLANRWLSRTPRNLTDAEQRVLQSAIDRKPVSRDTSKEGGSPGQRLADAIARVGGSWTFILWFLALLVVWTIGNAFLLGRETFDPYPFVFLNLVLSMLAALQAPVIMMSQNRQAERDRLDATHDYEVNLKAEIEIMALHEKLDELRHKEIIAIHGEIQKIGEALRRIESRLGTSASGTT